MLVALTHLVWSAWAFAVLCVLGAILVPRLRPVLAYGKLQLTNEGVIPQHLFWPAIYALGLLGNLIFAVLLLIWSGSSLAYLLLTIMFIHLSRRLAETILVHRFSRRFVQPLHAFLGPAYYIGVTMGSQIEELAYPHSVPHWSFVVSGLVLFLWASYQQFAAHATLASMRARPGRDSLYSIPSGRWFDLISCPHYAAEILIYTALVVLTGGRNVTLLLVYAFVVLTLSNAALNTHAWYRRKFPDYPRARKALVPGIL